MSRYNQRPEVKERRRLYNQIPEVKARLILRNQQPEFKERKKLYMKQHYQENKLQYRK